MEIYFTKHALLRMQQRDVSEREVYEVFQNEVLMLERKETLMIGRTNQGRFLTLVMDLKERRLLTLWPSSRAQRKVYQERIGKDEKENS